MKPVPAGASELVVTAGTREAGEAGAWKRRKTSFVTARAAGGSGYWVILQWKATPDAARRHAQRVKYLEGICDGGKLPEYACTCDHAH